MVSLMSSKNLNTIGSLERYAELRSSIGYHSEGSDCYGMVWYDTVYGMVPDCQGTMVSMRLGWDRKPQYEQLVLWYWVAIEEIVNSSVHADWCWKMFWLIQLFTLADIPVIFLMYNTTYYRVSSRTRQWHYSTMIMSFTSAFRGFFK